LSLAQSDYIMIKPLIKDSTFKIVEVFVTNVQHEADAHELILILSSIFPNHQINFDLTDCDRILRIKGEEIDSLRIIAFMHSRNFECEILK
jgi:hypothetical protein